MLFFIVNHGSPVRHRSDPGLHGVRPSVRSSTSVHDLGQCAHPPSKSVHEVDGPDEHPVRGGLARPDEIIYNSGKGGKEAKPKKGAKGGKSPAETPVKSATETPDIPVDEIIASRTFHLSRDKSENLIHCGGGPLVMENFIDPLEAAKDGQKPKKKKGEGRDSRNAQSTDRSSNF